MTQPDAVGQAIASVEAAPREVRMAGGSSRLGSGRPVEFALPADFTDAELVDAMGALLSFAGQVRAQFPPPSPALSRILVPGGRA